MGRKVFVTATDTDAGKTFITSRLIQLLLEQGIRASAIKPVACGINVNGRSGDGINEDVTTLMQAQNIPEPSRINLHTFAKAASPNIAAAAEGKRIEPEQLVAWCYQQAQKADLCLIEGVGGLMVPLNERYLVSDWIADMQDCEVMLVIGARLGCISHALLTLEQLKRLGVPPAYILVNDLDDSDIAGHAVTSLQPLLSPETRLRTIPYNAKYKFFHKVINDLLAKR